MCCCSSTTERRLLVVLIVAVYESPNRRDSEGMLHPKWRLVTYTFPNTSLHVARVALRWQVCSMLELIRLVLQFKTLKIGQPGPIQSVRNTLIRKE